MQHPDIAQCRFRLPKTRKRHLERKVYYIDDATCETEHDGTPPTLIITKTQASFEKEFKKHQPHQELLASLQLMNEASDGGPSAKRIKTDNGCSPASKTLDQ